MGGARIPDFGFRSLILTLRIIPVKYILITSTLCLLGLTFGMKIRLPYRFFAVTYLMNNFKKLEEVVVIKVIIINDLTGDALKKLFSFTESYCDKFSMETDDYSGPLSQD